MSCHRDSCCSNSSCSCSCHKTCGSSHHHDVCESHDSEEMCSEAFLELADQAWWEVLKEKIKDHIRTNNGKRMDDLAALVSEANSAKWMKKLEEKKCCGSFEEKLSNFFHQGCSESCSTKK